MKLRFLLCLFSFLSFLLFSPLVPRILFAQTAHTDDNSKEILRLLSQPENNLDLTELLLLISKDWDQNVDTRPLRRRLQEATDTVKNKIKPGMTANEIIEVLRTVIHREQGFRFTERVDPNGIPLNPAEIFLHGLLETKRGYCMTLSLLYLIVGDQLNLPLYGVALPNHFFVRYDDGNFRANIETTQRGQTFADSFYRERFLNRGAENRDFFLTNLKKKQTLGAYFNNVAMTHYRARRAESAIFYLEQSVALNPKALDVRNNLANVFSEQKKYDSAIEQYQQVLKDNPNHWQTYFNLGLAMAEAGREEDAIKAFRQSAQINPGHVPSHSTLVRLYMEQQRWADALIHLQSLVKLQPQNQDHRMRIAHAYLRMKQPEVALSFLQETQRKFPLSLNVNELMAEAHFQLKQYKASRTQLEYIIEKTPDSQHAHIQLGWILFLEGKFDEAMDRTTKGLSIGKDATMITLAHMNLGLYHAVQGEVKTAESWYQKALSSKAPMILDAMTQDLADAEKRFPDKPELTFFKGWVFFEAGNLKKAEPALQQFLGKNPKGPLADRARKMLQKTGKGDTLAADEIPNGMVSVPEGFFIMGSDNHGNDEAPQHKVYLDAFLIDEAETTTQEFADFLNTIPDVKNIKQLYFFHKRSNITTGKRKFIPVSGSEQHPANSVTWFGATAYCKWKKKRLPTEAEWEKAARGVEGNLFPWGNDRPSKQRARYLQSWKNSSSDQVTVPVKSMPEGKSTYGAYHMAGNVKEWVDDWFDREYYKQENHKVNPKGPAGGEFKVLKGGSWRDLGVVLYPSFRNNSFPKSGLDDYGVRCAKSVGDTEAPGRLARIELPAVRLIEFLE